MLDHLFFSPVPRTSCTQCSADPGSRYKWRRSRRYTYHALLGAQLGQYWVYILASKRMGTLYVGMTNDLARRVYEHREELVPGFTKDYGIALLVFAEEFSSALDARAAEARLKRWRRAWKVDLIERDNPNWDDLYPSLV